MLEIDKVELRPDKFVEVLGIYCRHLEEIQEKIYPQSVSVNGNRQCYLDNSLGALWFGDTDSNGGLTFIPHNEEYPDEAGKLVTDLEQYKKV